MGPKAKIPHEHQVLDYICAYSLGPQVRPVGWKKFETGVGGGSASGLSGVARPRSPAAGPKNTETMCDTHTQVFLYIIRPDVAARSGGRRKTGRGPGSLYRRGGSKCFTRRPLVPCTSTGPRTGTIWGTRAVSGVAGKHLGGSHARPPASVRRPYEHGVSVRLVNALLRTSESTATHNIPLCSTAASQCPTLVRGKSVSTSSLA